MDTNFWAYRTLWLRWACKARILLAAGFLAMNSLAQASELRVLAPNAIKHALIEVAERFQKETGHQVQLFWDGSESISRRVTEGEVFDLVFNTSQGVERMAAASKLDKGARADFCRSAVGVAVRTGVPRADVSTVEGLKAALLNSQSIAISSGASGRYIEQLFVKLGVAEQVKQKTKQPPSGAQIGEMLARGEAELGFQQVSELIHASGIQYLGSLPVELQNYTVWSAGVHASAPQPSIANTFLKTLGDSKSALALRNAGLEPM